MSEVDVAIPDLGNFDEVSVVEVLVKPGDAIEIDTPLITLETEKATMDVPSTAADQLAAVLVKAGDKVRKGTVIARIAAAEGAAPQAANPAVDGAAAGKPAGATAASCAAAPASGSAPSQAAPVPPAAATAQVQAGSAQQAQPQMPPGPML